MPETNKENLNGGQPFGAASLFGVFDKQNDVDLCPDHSSVETGRWGVWNIEEMTQVLAEFLARLGPTNTANSFGIILNPSLGKAV